MTLFLTLLLLLPLKASAVSFEIVGASGESIWQENQATKIPRNAGAITLDFMRKSLSAGAVKSFEGGEANLRAVNEYGSDVKVVDGGDVEFFQWCFMINGFQPGLAPRDTTIVDQNVKLTWYYAFSVLRQGEWISQCVPATQSRAKN